MLICGESDFNLPAYRQYGATSSWNQTMSENNVFWMHLNNKKMQLLCKKLQVCKYNLYNTSEYGNVKPGELILAK